MLESIHEHFSTGDFAQLSNYKPGSKSTDSLNSQLAGTTEIVLRNAAADNVELAAEWSQTKESRIQEISLMLRRQGTIAAGKIVRIRIETDASGLPSGTAIAWSETVAADTMAITFGFIKFTLKDELIVEAGKSYHAVLEGDYVASAVNHVRWRSLTVGSGGNQEIFDASWSNVATEDFEIHASVPAVLLTAEEAITVIGQTELVNPEIGAELRTADVPGITTTAKLTVGPTTYSVIHVGPDMEGHTPVMLSKD